MEYDVDQRYKGISSLSVILKYALYISIAVALVGLYFDFIEYRLLVSLRDHTFDASSDITAEANASDQNQLIMGVLDAIIIIANLIIWFVWIFKSNKLARSLGATNMKYSPAWSVGWYFVPFFNLVHPYFAMKEIYLATLSPRDFDTTKEAAEQPESLNFVILWWVLWVGCAFASNASIRYALKAESLEQLIFSNKLVMVTEGLSIISALACLSLVKELWRVQSEAFSARVNSQVAQ